MSRAAFDAILTDYMRQTGAKKGPDGALVYPPGVREKLESGEMRITHTPVPGSQSVSDLKIGILRFILLGALAAIAGAVAALAR